MSRTISYNLTPTPGTTLRTAKLSLDFIDFSSNGAFTKTVDEPDLCVLSNKNAPLDAPCTLTYIRQNVKNVYGNKVISEANQTPNKAGVKNVVKLDTVLTITDSVDATYRADVPFSCSISCTTGVDALLTDNIVLTLLSYAVSSMFTDATAAATVSSARIANIRRGAMVPVQQ